MKAPEEIHGLPIREVVGEQAKRELKSGDDPMTQFALQHDLPLPIDRWLEFASRSELFAARARGEIKIYVQNRRAACRPSDVARYLKAKMSIPDPRHGVKPEV
ncbi:MAG: hypothetical protein NVV63_02320 [Opitutus sp.]|nr:hypothetical protein [Opitutus sp.]